VEVSDLPTILSGTTAWDGNIQKGFDDFVNNGSRVDLAYCVPEAYLTNHPRINGQISGFA
jgi:hypothetical protein